MKNIKINLIFKIIFSVLLILFLVYNVDLEKFNSVGIEFLVPLLVSVLITLFSLFLMTIRWRFLLGIFFKTKFQLKILYQYYLVGTFFNIFLPGAIGGDIVRVQRLSSNHKLSLKKSTLTTLVERTSGVYGLLILLSLNFLMMNFPSEFNTSKYIPLTLLRLSPIFMLLLIPLIKWVLCKKDLHMSYVFIVKIIGISFLSQMGDVFIASLFSYYFNLNVPFYTFLFIMPFVYIATILPISFGGLGVREASFTGLMMLYGVDYSIAVLISLMMYLVKVLVGIIGYFVYLKET